MWLQFPPDFLWSPSMGRGAEGPRAVVCPQTIAAEPPVVEKSTAADCAPAAGTRLVGSAVAASAVPAAPAGTPSSVAGVAAGSGTSSSAAGRAPGSAAAVERTRCAALVAARMGIELGVAALRRSPAAPAVDIVVVAIGEAGSRT